MRKFTNFLAYLQSVPATQLGGLDPARTNAMLEAKHGCTAQPYAHYNPDLRTDGRRRRGVRKLRRDLGRRRAKEGATGRHHTAGGAPEVAAAASWAGHHMATRHEGTAEAVDQRPPGRGRGMGQATYLIEVNVRGGGRRAEAMGDGVGDALRRQIGFPRQDASSPSRLDYSPTRRVSTGFSGLGPTKTGSPNRLEAFSGVFIWAGNLHSKTGRS